MPLLPLFLRSYTSIAIAPTPALAASAKKLNNENPTLWSVTFMTGLPTIPGRTAPSIQPTLKVRIRGSLRTTLGPSMGAEDEESGREYAVDAIRYDCEEVAFAVSGS